MSTRYILFVILQFIDTICCQTRTTYVGILAYNYHPGCMPHNIQHIWMIFADIHIRLKYTHNNVTKSIPLFTSGSSQHQETSTICVFPMHNLGKNNNMNSRFSVCPDSIMMISSLTFKKALFSIIKLTKTLQ